MVDDPLLQATGLRVEYAGVPAVHDMELMVSPGQIVALVGANGAGKSSTLRAIAGVAHIAAGKVHLNGESLVGLHPHDIVGRGVAHVPEGRRLFGPLTVEENLRVGAYGVNDKVLVQDRLTWVCELFPVVGNRLKQRAVTLSGGEQQMTAVARGLMSDPDLLLLDEASLGVMPTVVNQIFDMVAALAAERDMAVVIADQNLERLLKICNHAYVLRSGSLILQGSGEELLASDEVRKAYLGM